MAKSLLERAALTLSEWESTLCTDGNPDCPGGLSCPKNAMDAARAVLAAIREPSEEMKRAGMAACGGDGSVLDGYEAMIDAALEEG